jgi:hypothetical protein
VIRPGDVFLLAAVAFADASLWLGGGVWAVAAAGCALVAVAIRVVR